jgi:hypothetical protein
MGGILVKCSGGAGGVEEEVKSFAGKPAPTGRRRTGHFLTGEKKGLAKQDLS